MRRRGNLSCYQRTSNDTSSTTSPLSWTVRTGTERWVYRGNEACCFVESQEQVSLSCGVSGSFTGPFTSCVFAGKTSIIKAISNVHKMHIYSVKLDQVSDDVALGRLLRNVPPRYAFSRCLHSYPDRTDCYIRTRLSGLLSFSKTLTL